MRIEQLTFTRFLAAISIVIFHYGDKSFLFNNEYVGFLFEQANIGVSYFFMLSGFVMIMAYGNQAGIHPVDYFKNRFFRIYPVYLLGLLLVFLGQVLTQTVDFLGLFLNIFMLQAWIPSKALSCNAPGWSLSVEFLFYAVFPFLFNKGYRKINMKGLLLLIILFWILSQVIFQVFFSLYGHNELSIMKDILKYNPLMHLNEFLVGNVAGCFFIRKLKDKTGNYNLLILILITLVILALKFPFKLNFHNGLLAVFFIPLILFISLNNGSITKLFQKKPLVFLGEISYGIYILQHPVYSLISAYSINKYFYINNTTIVFFIRFVVLIVVSSISYIYIEKPIQDKIKYKKRIAPVMRNSAL